MSVDDTIKSFGAAKAAGTIIRSPHEIIAALANEGEPIPLGWEALDRQLRGGGARAGRLIVLGGPPQSGKTTVLCQCVLHLSKTYPVYTLFSDEGDEGAATRIGVQLGVALEKIESQREEAAKEMEEKEGERSIFMVEPDRADSTPEKIIEIIAARHPVIESGARAVAVFDSIQTISKFFQAKRGDPNRRVSIELFMEQVRQWAIELRILFLLTSRSNRASYRSKRPQDNSEDMASFADAAAIEFGADVALVFGLPDPETRVGPVNIVKNRLAGSLDAFSHRYDETTGRMIEVDRPAVDDAKYQEKQARRGKTMERSSNEIELILKKKGKLTTRQVRELVGGRFEDIGDALRALEKTHAVETSPGRNGGILWGLKGQ